MAIKLILATLAVVFIFEGFLIATFEKSFRNALKDLSKKKSRLKEIGIIELIIGIMLLMISLMFF